MNSCGTHTHTSTQACTHTHQSIVPPHTSFSYITTYPWRRSMTPINVQTDSRFNAELKVPPLTAMCSQSSISLPCGTVLAGGMHNDLSLNPAFR